LSVVVAETEYCVAAVGRREQLGAAAATELCWENSEHWSEEREKCASIYSRVRERKLLRRKAREKTFTS
jgi:hypothetical protein